ncbi:WD40-repeat-containing domain protein [Zopfochytrium polystomum]|nr:WD40-repeat-containing domain protein [Zopfochytrium polystomum]
MAREKKGRSIGGGGLSVSGATPGVVGGAAAGVSASFSTGPGSQTTGSVGGAGDYASGSFALGNSSPAPYPSHAGGPVTGGSNTRKSGNGQTGTREAVGYHGLPSSAATVPRGGSNPTLDQYQPQLPPNPQFVAQSGSSSSSRQPPAPALIGKTKAGAIRFPTVVESLRHEFDVLVEDAVTLRAQRDEFEAKLNDHVLNDLSQFHKYVLDFQNSLSAMKKRYEDEISRLRTEIDLRSSGGTGSDRAGPGFPDGIPPPDLSGGGNSTSGMFGALIGNDKKSLHHPNGQEVGDNGNAPKRQRVEDTTRPMPQSDGLGQDSGRPSQVTQGVPVRNEIDLYRQEPSQRYSPYDHPPPYSEVQHSQQPQPVQPQSFGPGNIPHQPETGICDLSLITSPPWRKDGPDWFAVCNPKSASLKRARLNVDMLHNFEHSSVVCCVKFSADSRYLATGSNRTVRVYDVFTGKIVANLMAPETEPGPPQDRYVRSVCFSPNSLCLASGGEDQIIRIWDIHSGGILHSLRGHEMEIYSLDWSRDGTTIVSGSGDRSCRVWDSESGLCKMVLLNEEARSVYDQPPRESGVTSIALSPLDGKCLMTGSLDHMVRIWDLRSGCLLERFEGHVDSVYSVAFSPDGRSIVSGSLDQTIKIWDLHPTTISILSRPSQQHEPAVYPGNPSPSRPPHVVTTSCRHTFVGHKDFVLTVAFAGSNASFGRVANGGEPVSTAGNEALAEVEWVVSGSKDRSVTFWDARSTPQQGGRGNTTDLTTAAQFMMEGHKNSIISVSLAAIGGMFATGSGDRKARIWRVSAESVNSVYCDQ